jgi:hypothetical protein
MPPGTKAHSSDGSAFDSTQKAETMHLCDTPILNVIYDFLMPHLE